MRKISLIVIFLLLWGTNLSYAESVVLKSGMFVTGELIEKTDEYVKIDTGKSVLKIPFSRMDEDSEIAYRALPDKKAEPKELLLYKGRAYTKEQVDEESILKKALLRYQDMSSFQCNGAGISSTDHRTEITTGQRYISVKFQRPNYYLIVDKITDSFFGKDTRVAWSNGEGIYYYRGKKDKQYQFPTDSMALMGIGYIKVLYQFFQGCGNLKTQAGQPAPAAGVAAKTKGTASPGETGKTSEEKAEAKTGAPQETKPLEETKNDTPPAQTAAGEKKPSAPGPTCELIKEFKYFGSMALLGEPCYLFKQELPTGSYLIWISKERSLILRMDFEFKGRPDEFFARSIGLNDINDVFKALQMDVTLENQKTIRKAIKEIHRIKWGFPHTTYAEITFDNIEFNKDLQPKKFKYYIPEETVCESLKDFHGRLEPEKIKAEKKRLKKEEKEKNKDKNKFVKEIEATAKELEKKEAKEKAAEEKKLKKEEEKRKKEEEAFRKEIEAVAQDFEDKENGNEATAKELEKKEAKKKAAEEKRLKKEEEKRKKEEEAFRKEIEAAVKEFEEKENEAK